MIQQGDILFNRVNSIPKTAKIVKRSPKGFVFAEGEVTGHAHITTADIELFEHNGTLYMRNALPIEVEHEEHGTVTVPEGEWEVGRVVEYDPFEEAIEAVRD